MSKPHRHCVALEFGAEISRARIIGECGRLKLASEFLSDHRKAGNGLSASGERSDALSDGFVEVTGTRGHHPEGDPCLCVAHRAALFAELARTEPENFLGVNLRKRVLA
jgi:hypothetical protein